MASQAYMSGRKKYSRPQAMLWSNNSGTTVEDEETGEIFYFPLGNEIGSSAYSPEDANEFLILSDHNRGEIGFSNNRIESRERMVNGRMRSYHVADKLSVSTSWDMLPSRAYHLYPEFNSNGISDYNRINNEEFTVDGGAGGADMLEWYERYTGSFWLFLSYDKRTNFRDLEDVDAEYGNLNKYSQVIEVFFNQFSYDLTKRGASNFDFWNVSLELEEV
jgi:hypothetical protein